MLGKDQSVILQMLEVPGEGMKKLQGVKMELDDSAFPLLAGTTMSSDPHEAFGDADYALLVGARPRGPGMERKDLLTANAKIFQLQGSALNEVARRSCKTLVVGNPANTNALVAAHNAPDMNPENFMAMTKLDQSRAEGMLAEKYGCSVDEINRMIIWGNHSSTQYPDISHASIKGKWAKSVVDMKWYEGEFVPKVQKRGAEIIDARGASSAASAASAAVDHLNCLHVGSGDKWQSMGVVSHGEYGITPGLYYSVPTICTGDQTYRKIMGIPIDPYSAKKMNTTEKELLEERDGVKSLLGGSFEKIVKPYNVREKLRASMSEDELKTLVETEAKFTFDETVRVRMLENVKSAAPKPELTIVNEVLKEAGQPPYTKEIFDLMKGNPMQRKKATEMYTEVKIKTAVSKLSDGQKSALRDSVKGKKAFEF
mmetsp:Transcript_30268/g.116108  ORF Transcript_30268/g.116108 Transcript_30268/m.116108 type:complete len:427 (-) Transcript_30268:178-1458(-)